MRCPDRQINPPDTYEKDGEEEKYVCCECDKKKKWFEFPKASNMCIDCINEQKTNLLNED
ncbi:MAG: hypothetical protein ABI241_00635 [Bacteroidia bacterium]